MIITLNGANFNNPNLPTYIEKFEGFVGDKLQNIYLFDQGDNINNILDKKGGFNSKVVVAASATASMLPGGGINFTKNSVISAQPLNLREPFTIMAGMRIGLIPYSESGATLQALFGVPEYFQYGFAVYASGSAATVETDIMSVRVRQSYNGAQDSSKDAVVSAGANYIDYRTFFLKYNGNGTMTFSLFDGKAGGASISKVIDEIAYTTNSVGTENLSLAPCIGNPQGFFGGGSINLDVFGVYTKELTFEEMAINAERVKDIMRERGRFRLA